MNLMFFTPRGNKLGKSTGMSQNPSAPPKRQWPTFDQVCESIDELMKDVEESRRFPKARLRNRLLNLGLKEFLEPIIEDRVEDKCVHRRALEARGLPFRYLSQWDEAILAMAHYLSRFRADEGSELNVYALHRLSKGEDKTLSDWQTAKAKLYLELQNIILLLGKTNNGGRRSQICRIFAFSKLADVAFLTQSAVSLLGEQLGTGINVGFMFTDTFKKDSKIRPVSNNLIIEFHPGPNGDARDPFDFYSMHEILKEQKEDNLPFSEHCSVKWFKNSTEAFREQSHLKELFHLFPIETAWKKPDYQDPDFVFDGVYGMEGQDEPSKNQIFNSAIVMMGKAFSKYGESKLEDFNTRINQTVITNDWIRLQRAISAFDDPESVHIKAVDATSVKNSLSLHESDPTYRHWLRRSLSRVLHNPNKSLKRVYIFDDDRDQKAEKEFSTLHREMQYYIDYFYSDISEMSDVLHPKGEEKVTETPSSRVANAKLTSIEPSIEVYVTTTSILQDIASKYVDTDVLRWAVKGSRDSTSERLKKVDFITSSASTPESGMIYNFVNQRADPGELKFEAFLFRKPFNDTREEEILFESLDDLEGPPFKDLDFKKLQWANRVAALKDSIAKYDDRYKRILNVSNVPRTVDEAESSPSNLLKVRGAIETALYSYFAEQFDYLYEFLKYYSLKVDFFRKPRKRRIEEIDPFDKCADYTALTPMIKTVLAEKTKRGESPPKFESRVNIPQAAPPDDDDNRPALGGLDSD